MSCKFCPAFNVIWCEAYLLISNGRRFQPQITSVDVAPQHSKKESHLEECGVACLYSDLAYFFGHACGAGSRTVPVKGTMVSYSEMHVMRLLHKGH